MTIQQLNDLRPAMRNAIMSAAVEEYEEEENFIQNNEYFGILQMFDEAEKETEAFDIALREREAEILNEQFDGVNTMFEMAERETQFQEGVEAVHNYGDLEQLFERFPSARFTVRMYSGKVVTVTRRSFERLLADHYGDYNDQEDTDGNFEILSVLQHNAYVDKLIHQRIATAMGEGWQQPDLAGIDDVRYSIKEKHVSGNYFVPTNINCVGKCIFKFLEINGHGLEEFPELEQINFDTVTTIPEMNALLKKKKSKIRVVSYTTRPNEYYHNFITVPIYKYELPEKRGFFHAILILDVKKYRNLWKTEKKLPIVEVSLEYTEFEDLDQDALDVFYANERLKSFKPPPNPSKNRCVAAFDFETRKDHNDALTFTPILSPTSTCRLYKHVPAMLTWAWSPNDADYALDLNNPSNVINGGFMHWLKQRLVLLDQGAAMNDSSLREVTLFSFNGAAFDNHLFLDHLKHPEWKADRSFLGDEMCVKRFSISNKTLKFRNRVTFLDVRLFFPPNVSLKKACEMYGCAPKHDFDIAAHMTTDAILGNLAQYVEYGIQDSRSTYELVMSHRRGLAQASRKPELDMFDYVSLAQYASRVRDLYHPHDVEIWYNRRDEIAEFERNCVVGGRLIVGQLRCDEPCIAVDFNSLYATSMAMYDHPAGTRTFWNRRCHSDKMTELKHALNTQSITKSARVKLRYRINPKCMISMLPIKGDNNPRGLEKTGYFSSTDVLQAIKHGDYEVLEVLFAIEDELQTPIFRTFIDVFSTQRAHHKATMAQTNIPSEYARLNVLQELCKLIPNSSYGSLLLKEFEYVYRPMYISTFLRNHDPTLEVVASCGYNQVLVKIPNKCKHTNTRTISLGVSILANSKIPLNDVLDAIGAFNTPGKVLYTDTDSVYIQKSTLPVLEAANIIGNALGQAKNDYGDRTIVKFRCIGKKMKMCLLDDGSIKSTIKGFKGLNNLTQPQKEDLFDAFDYTIAMNNTGVFATKKYETMMRSGFNIKSTVATRSFRMTAQNQYIVDTDANRTCYPLYYNTPQTYPS